MKKNSIAVKKIIAGAKSSVEHLVFFVLISFRCRGCCFHIKIFATKVNVNLNAVPGRTGKHSSKKCPHPAQARNLATYYLEEGSNLRVSCMNGFYARRLPSIVCYGKLNVVGESPAVAEVPGIIFSGLQPFQHFIGKGGVF